MTLLCSNNNLTDLDVTQNTGLEWLICSVNQLTSLDLTQNSNIEQLSCSVNLLTSLDLTQNTMLRTLSCGVNQLSTLDVTQNIMLEDLYCEDNQLERLFIKNGSIESILNFSNNPNLVYICADDGQVTSVQEDAGSNVAVNSYCSYSLGGDYNTISGIVTLDANSSGCDANDAPQSNIKININDGTIQGSTFTSLAGTYAFNTEIGNFDIAPNIENPNWFSVSPVAISTISFTDSNNNNNITTQDFCITPNGIFNDVEIIISPLIPSSPGFDAIYQIVYKNKGTETISGAVDVTFNDTVLDYVSASINPDTQATGNLSWNYTDLLPFENRSIELTLNVNSPMETPAVNIDDVLNFTVTVNPVSGDELPDDNVFEFNQTVIGSFDPNDITCLEGDIVNPDQIGEYLRYNINFENTGTAAATFVVVKDVIDETNYDISSLQIMHASHEMQARVIDNTIEFIFDNINLEPNGKGNIVFKIKTKNTLTVGNAVSNQAEIFFDYNFPIVTNIATTNFQVLSVDEFASDDPISVFPNPSKNLVTLASKNHLKSIQVYDAMSRIVFESSMDSTNYTLDVSSYESGIYFLKIKTVFGEKVKKFIKN
jgi:hypothetical protein